MSLNWLWSEHCGEITFEQNWDDGVHEFTVQLYEGNAFLIMLNEWTGEDGKGRWTMWNFFADKEHAKKCLGLQKNWDGEKRNLHNDGMCRFTKIRINKARHSQWKDVVTMFAQAFDNITIEVFTEKESEG